MELKMTIAEVTAFLEKVFPQIDKDFEVVSLSVNEVIVRMRVEDRHLRPGGTVSGPAMFALADVSYYIATLALIGPEALCVTSNCAINFMRKPAAHTDLIGKARVLKLGRRLSMGDVLLYSEGENAPVAHANMTYSIPQKR